MSNRYRTEKPRAVSRLLSGRETPSPDTDSGDEFPGVPISKGHLFPLTAASIGCRWRNELKKNLKRKGAKNVSFTEVLSPESNGENHQFPGDEMQGPPAPEGPEGFENGR
jgi:hypothetical protein